MKQNVTIKHFYLSFLFILITTGSFSQVIDSSYSYMLELRQSGLWTGNQNSHTLLLTARNDNNNAAEFVDPRNITAACYTFAGVAGPFVAQSVFTTNAQSATGKIDLSLFGFDLNNNRSGFVNACSFYQVFLGGGSNDIERFRSSHLLPDPRTVQRSNATYNEFFINHAPGGSTTFREYWRYNKGTKNNPLYFDDITYAPTKTHTNNNIPTTGAYSNYGYPNDFPNGSFNNNSPDVSYTFNLTAPATVTISTANPGTNFNTILVLFKIVNELNFYVTSNDDVSADDKRSIISAELCPGQYRVVVEGGTANDAGIFELQVNANVLTPAQIIPTIENGHAIPNPQQLFPDFVAGLNPIINYMDLNPFQSQVTVAWEKNDGMGWQELAPRVSSQSYTLPALTQNTQYRRRNRGCNNTAIYSNTALIRVVNPNGVISGKVKSISGAGVKGIAIAVKNRIAIPGSPAGFTYRDTTDDQGNYSVQPIYYGRTDSNASAEFVVKPFKLNHKFDNDSLKKTLTNFTAQATGVDFIDSTVYSISGKVVQECIDCTDASGNIQAQTCPLDSVRLSSNVASVIPVLTGFSEQAAAYGSYALAAQNPGTYNVTPNYRNHLFTPPIQTVTLVTDDASNVNFKDISTRVISGKLTAGCNDFIGTAVLEFTDVLPNDNLGNPRSSCFSKRVTTNGSGSYSITLPARKYKVAVISFVQASNVSQADVSAFFAATKFERDITERDTTLNLVYQRPPVIELLGLNNDCAGLGGNTTDSAFVVIPQSTTRQFLVKVYQGPLVNGIGCPAADTNLRIITNIQNEDNVDTFTRRTVNGIDTIRLKGGTPNIVYPHFKTLNISYRDIFGRLVQLNRNVVVTGLKSNVGTFTTVSPQIPLMVLHDPPGDNSFSFWEKNKSVETAMRFYSASNVGGNLWSEVKLGTKVELGLGVSTETSVWGSLNASLSVNARNANTSETIVTTSTTDNFSTSNNPSVTGADGDVFIGAALNLKYAVANEIKYTAPCNLSRTERLMIANDGFGTKYIYSEGHIKNNIIPTLINFRDNPGNTAVQIANWQNQINVWQQMLANNDANKRRAVWVDNYSFDGNAGPYTSTTTTTSSKSSTIEFAMEIDRTLALELGFEIGGSGLSGGAMVNFKTETGNSTTNTITNSTTLGYTLDDDDDRGDFFSVTIKKDPVYNSPVFEMEAGTSSCPHETGTQPRDEMQLVVPAPIVSGLGANDTAFFNLQLSNTSQSREERTYLLSFVQGSNPDGANVTIGGSPVLLPIPYTISYLGTVNIKVGVKRSGNVFAYEGLQFLVTDNCGDDVSKTASISAFFTAPCSSIKLASPENNWTNTSINNNIIPVLFKGYTVANLTTVALEYSKAGLSNWTDGFSRTAAQIVNSINGTLVNWNVAGLTDGTYNLRLKLTCAAGIIYSERVTGIIDRKGPSLLGITQPTDDNYVNGDIIAADYNENIDCNSLTNFNVELKRLSNNQLIEARLGCYQNNIVVVPLTPITSFVGDSMEVTLRSIADLYGNIKPASDSWRFIVGSSVPDVSSRALKLVNNKPSVLENSGDSIIYTFKLPVNTPNDVRVNYSISGNSTPGTDYNVVYGQTPTQATSYTGSQGSIIIKAGTNSSTLKVKPIPNTQFAPNKTITLSLAEGGNYLLGDSTIATGTIINDDIPNTYTFTGNGNFTEVSNWQNGLVPPYNSLISDEIIIDPAGNGECIVNVPVRMRAGGRFTIAPGKKVIINGNVRVAN